MQGATNPSVDLESVCAFSGRRGRVGAVTGRHILGWSVVAALLWVPSCGPAPGQSTEASSHMSSVITQLSLTSPAFADGKAIPSKYTCDGDNVSPPLTWGPAPEGTAAWVLIAEDIDARLWVHWLVVNLPASVISLPEGASGSMPQGAVEGGTDNGPATWGGPCPPSGEHRYVFTVYALAEPLVLGPELAATQIRADMYGKVLAEAKLTGTYQRKA